MRTWQEELKERFGDRLALSPLERLLYSHDVGAPPAVVARQTAQTAEAVVQPQSCSDLIFLTELSRRCQIPLTPRGKATAGYGGAVPSRGGIVVDFTQMKQIVAVNREQMTLTVEPGAVWGNLAYELAKQGLALRLYPTSAPGSTVGGWVAQGGIGLGSLEYGEFGQNLVRVRVVTPDGTACTLTGPELLAVYRAEGTTGLISEVTLRIREATPEVPVLLAFKNVADLAGFVAAVSSASLPLWSLSFQTPTFHAKSRFPDEEELLPPGAYTAMVVYPAPRAAQVEPGLTRLMQEHHGWRLPAETAQHEWERRFYPMRLKRLGPSLVPGEAVVSAGRLAAALGEMERALPGLAVEGMLARGGDVALLGFMTADERHWARYAIDWAKSLTLLDIAAKHGGRPYAAGRYFGDRAAQIYEPSHLAQIQEFKDAVDPGGLMNPDKVNAPLPPLLRAAMATAQLTRPVLPALSALTPRLPMGKKGLTEELAYEAFACAQCGYCNEQCTLHMGIPWESSSPRGKLMILRLYLQGKIDFTEEMVDNFLLCTTCKRCDAACQLGIPIMDLWDAFRGVMIQEKKLPTFPAFEMMGASVCSQLNIWAAKRSRRDAWVPKEVQVLPEGEIGYWAGCTASMLETDIAECAVRVLNDAGVPFTYLGQDENCCGTPMLVAGKWDVYADIVRHNIEHLKQRGIKTLVVSCPGCWVSLAHGYHDWAEKLGLEYDVKVVHITELMADLIKEGRLQFKQPVNERVTWHDSCHIGRHGGIYEPPREVLRAIPGVDFVEMEHIKEDGLCCGSVLTRIGTPQASNRIGAMRLKEAEAVGARVVAATCPCCEFQMRVANNENGQSLQIRDIASIVAESMGYEVHDPTGACLAIWTVFEGCIKLMTAPAPGGHDERADAGDCPGHAPALPADAGDDEKAPRPPG